MNRIVVVGAVLLSLAFLALISPSILNPVLYTPENESTTPHQANPAALEQLSQEKSAELSGVMQALMDAPHPVMLNIRIGDFEEAEREFEEYSELSRSFDSLVLSLGLSESVVGDFQRQNRKSLIALDRIMTQSVQFDEINELETRYRSEYNPALLYSVVHEGEAVFQALSNTGTQFRDLERDTIGISRELGLNVSRYHEAVEILDEIMEADRVRQNERSASQPVRDPSTLALFVFPRTGTYGDVLQITGTRNGMPPTEVSLILDGRMWKIIRSDENGLFRTTLPIDTIPSGNHGLFAFSGNLFSDIVSFTIEPSDTSLSLECEPAGSGVSCSGILLAGEVPVRNAPVRILVDGGDLLQAETGEDGTYVALLTHPAGVHSLQAVFRGGGYPLNPSESVVRMVTISPAMPLPLAVLIGIGFIGSASLGAFWYLRRQNRVPVTRPAEEPLTEAVPDQTGQHHLLPSPADVLISYHDLVAAGDGIEAARVLYRSLISRITFRTIDPSPKTPRELLALVADSHVTMPFTFFVSRYEEVRYGGFPITARDPLLSHWNEVLALLEEGSRG